MTISRYILLLLCVILFIAELAATDINDLSWAHDERKLLGLIGLFLMILVLSFLAIRSRKEKSVTQKPATKRPK